MNKTENMEIHTIEIDGHSFRITGDPWTGDWCVEDLNEEIYQPVYVTCKEGAIEYVLEKAGLKRYGGYKLAPDRTSA